MADGSNPHDHRFGSLLTGAFADAELLKRTETFNLLAHVCEALEPTPTQMDRAKTSYETASAWLADDPQLAGAEIYVQGSAAHRTMVKPLGRNEHDVDLICRVANYGPWIAPAELKRLVGDRLKAHGVYRKIIEEKSRCWRLNFAGDFHLDLTPSVPNPNCDSGGELVPDKLLRDWKPSNPAGFRDLFARRAELVPLVKAHGDTQIRADAAVEAFPSSIAEKGVLRRVVQLLKRHRDLAFQLRDSALSPLSIIITALASKAYEFCVRNYPYNNELDLVCDTIRAMPWFIEEVRWDWGVEYLVPNETTEGENFAEKWRPEPARRLAFLSWQAKALEDFEGLKAIEGIDAVYLELTRALGEEPLKKAMGALTDEIGRSRRAGSLFVRPGVGLSAAAAASASSTSVRANTFYGR